MQWHNNTNATAPAPAPHPTKFDNGYHWVGLLGVLMNATLATVAFWRIIVHHLSYKPYLSCSSKRLFHWLILVGRLAVLPQFIGILVEGEFSLNEYTLHTLNNVFQSAALAIVIKEWAFVIAILRQHSFTTSIDTSRNTTNTNTNTGNNPLLHNKNSLYDSSGSGTYGSNARIRDSNNTNNPKQTQLHNDRWTGKQRVTCVRTVAIVYVAVFAVLCISAFIAVASGPYDLSNPKDTGTFFRTETHVVYISLETFWEATIAGVFLAYGLSLRNSLIENSPPKSQGRVRKTLMRINVVVIVTACCSFLRLGLHVRSLFGKNARTDPHWITVLTYYILYDFVGRGLPAVILLILMRNPDASYGRSTSTREGTNSNSKIERGNNLRNSHQRSGTGRADRQASWTASPNSNGVESFPDWPSESSRSQYGGTFSDGSRSDTNDMSPRDNLHNRLGSDEVKYNNGQNVKYSNGQNGQRSSSSPTSV